MISYRIDVAGARAHLFRVTLRIERPAREQRVSLPAWIPGSYLVREFARHLSRLRARQGQREARVEQLDKASWLVRCEGTAALILDYDVYAFDTSVRAAFLDAGRGFFNATSVCLRIHDREGEPHAISFAGLPRDWQIATAMPRAEGGSGYRAPDYDALVDHPFELGRFWRGTFTACGVPHEFVVTGAWPGFDGARLLADTRRICEAQIALWHGADAAARDVPFERYVFLLNAVDEGQGGLEHRASTALIAPRRKLPRAGMLAGAGAIDDGYADLLGLVSHEYFHTWNVKRMRPAEFAKLDYTRENYTELLWFFEGFTSYYDDLMLVRAGLVDDARYLALVAKNVNAVLGAPGRRVQSVAQASFDAWVKYYRSDENTPNATISYYAKGALVALALDLSLRSASGGRATLDAVMRALWAASGGGPITEADILAATAKAGGARRGKAIAASLAQWVHGTGELPLAELLTPFGVKWRPQAATLAQRLGVRVAESALTGVKLTHVLRGGAAEQAGLSAGDELLALDGWRLRRLDDAQALLAPQPAPPRKAAPRELLVSRDQRVLRIALAVPAAGEDGASVQLVADGAASAAARALRRAWLGG
ncbi:MAG: M61 family metallopeptidase [Burkholderiaceae bacterium]|nr:M61 family metallopeptidase [Burkholderiaceae bacterium]